MLQQISHYRILKKLGEGGMGEVYLAEDTKLTRKVALKILPADGTNERRRLNRFLQEARLAANLNHQHICTIYEIEENGETPFLAMEFVEGETLSERIAAGMLDVHEILNVASQIADALAEAHRIGIIHRDIKASNIIINRRGLVKVLDFGLAKVISEEVSEQDITRAKTEYGMLVGTVQYMSPEQALGKKLDGRTDLWSLGVLLYEMATRRLPFLAVTQAGSFDEILHKTPSPISEDGGARIPAELENIIFKLLEKDRDLRYQTAPDLLADLRRLRRSIGDISSDSQETVRFSGSAISLVSVNSSDQNSAVHRRTIVGVSAAIVVLAMIVGAVWFFKKGAATPNGFKDAVTSRVTNLGKVYDAAISPDAKFIVYVIDDGARQSLTLKQMATGSTIQIIPPGENVFQGIAVSPDNNWVYFNVWDRKSVGQIYRVPALGGTPEKIVHDCMPGVSVSPDGAKLTFVRSDDSRSRFVLLSVNADGSDEVELFSATDGFMQSPAWSPDGSSVATAVFLSDEKKRYSQIIEIPAAGGKPSVIWKDESGHIQPSRLVWLADKGGLLATLSNSREFQTQIWRIDYLTGAAEQLTRELISYNSLSISADGKNLVAIQQDFVLSVWTVPAAAPSQARRITEGKTEGVGLNFTSDDQILYASNVTGSPEIWKMKPDGSEKKQLTTDRGHKLNPCTTSDSRYIFHNIVGNERGGSARIDIDGRNSQILERKWYVFCAQKAPYIFYFTVEEFPNGEQTAAMFRNNLQLTEPVRITSKPVQYYAVSPDAKSVAYIYWDETKKAYAMEIQTIETPGVRSFTLPLSAVQKYGEMQFVFRWTPDGKSLSFVNDENGFSNIWLLPLNGEKPRRVTSFNDNYIHSFAWSPDGKNLAVSRGTLTSDAVLLKQKE